MKKTQVKDALRNIGKKKIAFMSILIIVFLGVGCFLWLGFVKSTLKATAYDYLAAHKLADLEMYSPLGVTADNIAELEKSDHVLAAEGVVQISANIGFDDEILSVSVLTLTEKVNLTEVMEGTLPSKEDECAVSFRISQKYGVGVGDKVTLTDAKGAIKNKEFTVTALVTHPSFYSNRDSNFVLVDTDAIDLDKSGGAFTKAVILLDLPKGTAFFGNAYFNATKQYEDSLGELSKQLLLTRSVEVSTTAHQKFDDGVEEFYEKYAEAEKEMNEKLADGKAKLDDAKIKIEEGKKEFAEKEKLLIDGEREFAEQKAEVEREIAAAKEKIEVGRAELEKGDVKLEEAKKMLEQAEVKLSGALDQIEQATGIIEMVSSLTDKAKQYMREELEGIIPENLFNDVWDAAFLSYYEYKSKVIYAYSPVVQAEVDQMATDAISMSAESDIYDARQKFINSQPILQLIQWVESLIPEGEIKNTILDAKNTVFTTVEDLVKAEAARPIIYEAADKLKAGKAEIENGKAEIEKNKKLIEEGEKELSEKEAYANDELVKAEQKITDGRIKLEEGRAELEKGIKEYEDGLAEYEKGKAEAEKALADAKAEFEEKTAEGEKEIEKIETLIEEITGAPWIIQNRNVNAGFVSINSMINALSVIDVAFASLFLIVGALVCFSTMAIIISEQKKLIGATKAFGFFGGEVFGKYALFGAIATVVGLGLGVLIAYVAEGMLLKGFNDSFASGEFTSVIDAGMTTGVCVVSILLSLVTTFVSCREVLKKPASTLMSGSDDTQKRQKALKKEARGSVFSKLIKRNMKSELARVIVSIVIVLGSIMIIGVGFTLKYAFDRMMNAQYNDVVKYDYKVTFGDASEEDISKLKSIMDEKGAEYVSVSDKGYSLNIKGQSEAGLIITADEEELDGFFGVNDDKTLKPLEFSSDGIIINCKLAEKYGLKVGDKISVFDLKLVSHEVTITGIFRNYQGRTSIMSREAGAKYLGESDNCFYVKYKGDDVDGFVTAVAGSGVNVVIDSRDAAVGSILFVSDILTISILGLTFIAILMMVIVLTNLTNIFVNKRLKEIAIMRINGFSLKETVSYLIRETVLTNVIGIVAGIGLGGIIGYVIMVMMEQTDMRLVRSFNAGAWAIAFVLTAVSAVAINAIAFRKIKKLSLTDAK